jgi:hypothetical protein
MRCFLTTPILIVDAKDSPTQVKRTTIFNLHPFFIHLHPCAHAQVSARKAEI